MSKKAHDSKKNKKKSTLKRKLLFVPNMLIHSMTLLTISVSL